MASNPPSLLLYRVINHTYVGTKDSFHYNFWNLISICNQNWPIVSFASINVQSLYEKNYILQGKIIWKYGNWFQVFKYQALLHLESIFQKSFIDISKDIWAIDLLSVIPFIEYRRICFSNLIGKIAIFGEELYSLRSISNFHSLNWISRYCINRIL